MAVVLYDEGSERSESTSVPPCRSRGKPLLLFSPGRLTRRCSDDDVMIVRCAFLLQMSRSIAKCAGGVCWMAEIRAAVDRDNRSRCSRSCLACDSVGMHLTPGSSQKHGRQHTRQILQPSHGVQVEQISKIRLVPSDDACSSHKTLKIKKFCLVVNNSDEYDETVYL